MQVKLTYWYYHHFIYVVFFSYCRGSSRSW